MQCVCHFHRWSFLCIGKLDLHELLLELFRLVGPLLVDTSKIEVLIYDFMMLLREQARYGSCLLFDVINRFSHDVRLQILHNLVVLQLHLSFLFLNLKYDVRGCVGTLFCNRIISLGPLRTAIFVIQWLLLSFVIKGSVNFVGAPTDRASSPEQRLYI